MSYRVKEFKLIPTDFKNVSLSNVLRSAYSFSSDDRVTFLGDKDEDLFRKTVAHAFDVQMAVHLFQLGMALGRRMTASLLPLQLHTRSVGPSQLVCTSVLTQML